MTDSDRRIPSDPMAVWFDRAKKAEAERDALAERNAKLLAALRKHAIVDNGFVHWCVHCGHPRDYWNDGESEIHAPDCLAKESP